MDGWMEHTVGMRPNTQLDGNGFILFACYICIVLTIPNHLQAGDELISTHIIRRKDIVFVRSVGRVVLLMGFTGCNDILSVLSNSPLRNPVSRLPPIVKITIGIFQNGIQTFSPQLYILCVFTPLRSKVRRHRHEAVAQQKRRIARFWRLTLPKTPLRTVFYSVFVLCEAETTANSDVFELAVAQNTAIYSVFEPAVKKNTEICDVFNNMVAKNTAICEVLAVLRKELKPQQCTKTL